MKNSLNQESPVPQSADGESNKIVSDKKKTDTAWMFDTYRVRNHLVPNPINPKLKRLKKYENIKWEHHCFFDKIIEQSTIVWSAD